MSSVLVTHARFQRPPVVQKRRGGRLPRGIVPIIARPPLRTGAVAEITASNGFEGNIGIHVRIIGQATDDCDLVLAHFGRRWECQSLDRDIERFDGTLNRVAPLANCELRRVWSGLTKDERIKLRLWREVRAAL
jgi:hypothetical protein